MEDEKIIELYWQRSPQAIDETSRKYGAYCMRLSMNILMNREDSEENVNDTYLRTWNAIPPQRPRFFAAFLGRIARNLALNRYKARAAEKRGGGEAALSLEELAECLPSGSEPQDEAEAAAFSHLLSEFLRTESEEAPGVPAAIFHVLPSRAGRRPLWIFRKPCQIHAAAYPHPSGKIS